MRFELYSSLAVFLKFEDHTFEACDVYGVRTNDVVETKPV
ncbi:hypothetical protein PEB0150_010280 [Bartonella apis]|nr:hypothetical protein PEB0150_010280 [Bartonella apis]